MNLVLLVLLQLLHRPRKHVLSERRRREELFEEWDIPTLVEQIEQVLDWDQLSRRFCESERRQLNFQLGSFVVGHFRYVKIRMATCNEGAVHQGRDTINFARVHRGESRDKRLYLCFHVAFGQALRVRAHATKRRRGCNEVRHGRVHCFMDVDVLLEGLCVEPRQAAEAASDKKGYHVWRDQGEYDQLEKPYQDDLEADQSD
mmetsp:Transcript_18971/g.52253  ORF Transcript_18971/g.52253 Transcript_18971/m.52253 type:complete len:202 (+) Transcript_18971:483-1088(+)